MLKISRLADYAARILFLLGSSPQKRYSAAQVAQETQIAGPTVSKVLKLLHEARLVTSERGAMGGYQLIRAPGKITIAEIIAAIDGELAMTECSKENSFCEHQSICELRNHWQSINQIIFDVLQYLTLADMQRPQAISAFKEKLMKNMSH